MVDQIDRARLVDEAHRHIGTLGQLRIEDFYGDATLDRLVNGFIDRAHAALPKLAFDPIWA